MTDDPTQDPVAVTPLLWVGDVRDIDHEPFNLWTTNSANAARWIDDLGSPVLVSSFEVAQDVLFLLGASKEDAALAITSARDGLANMKTQL